MLLFRDPKPQVVKQGGSARGLLSELEALRGSVPKSMSRRLEADIRNVKAGIAGEDRIMYELMNSHMEMWVLHDLYLECNGLAAQIDFLVITRRRNFILECKNLYGNVRVDSKGQFVRLLPGSKREAIYSPITQSQRHLELVHAMRHDEKGLLANLLSDSSFDDLYRGFAVFANPNSVLDDKYAKKDVKARLIRADALVETMKRVNAGPGPGRERCSAKQCRELAEWFLSKEGTCPTDYAAKYRDAAMQPPEPATGEPTTGGRKTAIRPMACPRCGAPMVLREAKRGGRKGRRFYGCSTYPHCHMIVNIDAEGGGSNP